MAEAGKAVGFLSLFPSLPQLDSCMAYNMLYTRYVPNLWVATPLANLSLENIYIMIYYKSKL